MYRHYNTINFYPAKRLVYYCYYTFVVKLCIYNDNKINNFKY